MHVACQMPPGLRAGPGVRLKLTDWFFDIRAGKFMVYGQPSHPAGFRGAVSGRNSRFRTNKVIRNLVS